MYGRQNHQSANDQVDRATALWHPFANATSVASCPTHGSLVFWVAERSNHCPSPFINHTKHAITRQILRTCSVMVLSLDSQISRSLNRPRISHGAKDNHEKTRKQGLAQFVRAWLKLEPGNNWRQQIQSANRGATGKPKTLQPNPIMASAFICVHSRYKTREREDAHYSAPSNRLAYDPAFIQRTAGFTEHRQCGFHL